MQYAICCGCSMLCFLCGAWVAGGVRLPRRRRPEQRKAHREEDALSRDIEAMLAYTIPGREETNEEE